MKNPFKSWGQALGKVGAFFVNIFEFIWSFIVALWEAPMITIIIMFIAFMTWFTINHYKEPKVDRNYKDFDLVIIDMNKDISHGKAPQLCNIVLFKTTSAFEKKYDTCHLYREINTCNTESYTFRRNIDTKWMYNHQIGDTIHFERMLRSEFFSSPVLDKELQTDTIKVLLNREQLQKIFSQYKAGQIMTDSVVRADVLKHINESSGEIQGIKWERQ